MTSLKTFILALCAGLLITSCKDNTAVQHPAARTVTHAQIVTPNDALVELKAGNKRYMGDTMINNTDYSAQRDSTRNSQHPHSAVLSCLDSRVPPEVVFDQRLGDLFVTRVAGNIEDSNSLGSLEYATRIIGSKLIVVMGHQNCGAIKGAIDNVELGNLTQLLNQIKPAIVADPNRDTMIEKTAKNNVRLTIGRILHRSRIIDSMVKGGSVKIVGAYYDLASGKVEFMD